MSVGVLCGLRVTNYWSYTLGLVTSLGYTGYKEGLVADGKRASLAW